MQLIKNNPYRTIGLLVGATAREQEKQIRKLKQFIEAEQEPQDDFSFPTLGQLNRTVDSVTDAASKLNNDSDKMSSALFWFYKGNTITDEPAFDAIKDSDLDQVISIWTKLTSNGEVSQRNASAYSNLGTLYLSGILEGTNTNEALLEQGISLKLKFLESDFIKDFKALATDETYKTTKKELQLLFLNQVQNEIEKKGEITSRQFLEIINRQSFSAKEDFLKGFVQKPIEVLEKMVDDTKSKRKLNNANAINVGKKLYQNTSENLSQLKSILGTSSLKYTSIADKVADEILQCGITYFNSQTELDSKEAGNKALELCKKAKSIGVGKIINQRCDEQSESINEQIRLGGVTKDLEKLKNLIDVYDSRADTASNAKQLLTSAKPHLNNLKAILGSTDELYLGFSSRIASDAQGMCVSEINNLKEKLNKSYDNATKLASLILLKQKVNDAWETVTIIGGMDLKQDFRTRYVTNRSSLSSLKDQLAKINTGSSGSSGSGGSGCYIATMAYGDYDHPQVMVLRKFRDNVLDKSIIGKLFIKKYYDYSPKLVKRLENKKIVNGVLRKMLNVIVRIVR